MKLIGINKEKCIHCGKCVKVCPSRLFIEEEKEQEKKVNYNFVNPYGLCIACGHCIAVCPSEAILYEEAEEPCNFKGTKKLEEIVPYNEMVKALRMRRSIRVYKDEQLQKEQITKVLEAMRYAPTASNRQNWRYIVITNKTEIDTLSKETAKFFPTARKLLPMKYFALPFLTPEERRRVQQPKTKIQLENAVRRMKKGEDIIFFNAPCVIILYSRNYTNGLADNDAGIALTYGMLAAQALGFGTCWIGFAQRKMRRSRKLRNYFGIPKGFTVRGVLTMGIPKIAYERAPPRKKLKVAWIE